MSSLYNLLGPKLIEDIITEFYDRAFQDPIIGHLFWNFDQDHLTKMQISFAKSMLGGSEKYEGQPLESAHKNLNLNQAHFGRRQVLMKDVLDEYKVDNDIRIQWLVREEKLRPLIVNSSRTCQS